VDRRDYDVVCIGGGGAGVEAAMTAARSGARVALLSKEPLGYGNTRIAYGVKTHPGLAPEDSFERLYKDMLEGSDYLSNPQLARVVAEESVLSTMMMESCGYIFPRDENGQLSEKVISRSGGHSIARTLVPFGHGGGAIGQAMRSAASRSALDVMEEVAVTRLLVEDNQVRGLVVLRLSDGELMGLGARAIILATGGAGWLYYPHTDCLRVSTGDGYALALDTGAELIDMEQVQFIPFAVTHPRALVGIVLGEPGTAGPYGRLIDGEGRVVATRVNVLTRAQVAVIISRAVESGRGAEHGGLLLDLAPNYAGEGDAAALARDQKLNRFKLIKRAYGQKAFNLEEPWEVLPSAHFSMGGVVMDEYGRTSVQGLYAAGEVSGGIHGANRLGSVALSDIFIFGRRAGKDAACLASGASQPSLHDDDLDLDRARIDAWSAKRGRRPIELVRALQRTMWENVGLVRDETRGRRALQDIAQLEQESTTVGFTPHSGYCTDLLDAIELELMLKTARAMALSSLERRESRGAHARSDYPERDDADWLANVCVRADGDGLKITVRPSAAAAELRSQS